MMSLLLSFALDSHDEWRDDESTNSGCANSRETGWFERRALGYAPSDLEA
jgi:hypothetical protein